MACEAILTDIFNQIPFDKQEKHDKIGLSVLFVRMANRRLEQFEKK